jgi:hypothetical protein
VELYYIKNVFLNQANVIYFIQGFLYTSNIIVDFENIIENTIKPNILNKIKA